MNLSWKEQDGWITINTIDAHTAGEPLRVIVDGFPAIPGDTILEKRRYARQHLDHLRTGLMWEPRGHADMYGCIITEPVTDDGTLGVLFMHNEGYSSMCGHGIIGLTKVVLDTGMLVTDEEQPEIKIDTPAGRVTATAQRINGKVDEVSFLNVPSFVYALDLMVDVPGLGPVRYDLAFGGAYYAFVQAEEIGVGLDADDFRQLIDTGMRIKQAVADDCPIQHPYEPDLSYLYGTIFIGDAQVPGNHSRNVCVFADGEVDRCPTGTGVSARAAIYFARRELGMNESFVVESILGTCFAGEVVETTTFGPHEAVIPKVTGTAYIYGCNQLLIDPQDPLRDGFILR